MILGGDGGSSDTEQAQRKIKEKRIRRGHKACFRCFFLLMVLLYLILNGLFVHIPPLKIAVFIRSKSFGFGIFTIIITYA